MKDDERFEFMIYHEGVRFQAPVRGKARLLKERRFLDSLIALEYGHHRKCRPVPDPSGDFYMLDDAEFDANVAFQKELDIEYGRYQPSDDAVVK